MPDEREAPGRAEKRALLSLLAQPPAAAARALLGQVLVRRQGRRVLRARIVETEAYLGRGDAAAHVFRGRTARTAPLFGPPGTLYVYLVYGLHHCFNVVTEREGHAAAVLVRAVEPLANLAGNTRGPGLVCRALGIDRRQSGHDLLSDDLFIARPARRERFAVATRPRVGVDYAGAWARRLLRFYVRGNRWVSRP